MIDEVPEVRSLCSELCCGVGRFGLNQRVPYFVKVLLALQY